ncbi:MAG: AAA family ATPase [Planctomycetota bacterium]
MDRPPAETGDALAGVPIDDVLEALQATTTRIGDLLPSEATPQSPPDAADQPAAETDTAAEISPPAFVPTGSASKGVDDLEAAPAPDEPDRPATVYRVDAGTPAGSTAGQTDGQPVGPPHVERPTGDVREGNDGPADAGAPQQKAGSQRPGDQTFQPMLQVDRFTWPAVCRRLGEAAREEFDRLADRLADVMAEGNKVVAIGGCQRGEGATTLLLCAASRLAGRGLKVLMADANLADPQLACRLGLSPESGWEDVLSRRLPLEEVVIESAGDSLAVLPVCQAAAGADEAAEDETRLVESLQTLSAHYDLVLLDPGPLEELGAVGASLARAIGSRLDAILLVHHGGVTPQEDLDEVRRCLAASEIVQVGVVENFVRD